MIGVRTNLKESAKEMHGVGLNIYKAAGETIAVGVWKEFIRLVSGTAQYTGSTTASWNIAAKGAGSFGGVRMQPARTRNNALQVGHSAAVHVALNANKGNIDFKSSMQMGSPGGLYKQMLTSGLNVWNESPGAISGVPFNGPLRSVNKGSEMVFDIFKDNVNHMVFKPLDWAAGRVKPLTGASFEGIL